MPSFRPSLEQVAERAAALRDRLGGDQKLGNLRALEAQLDSAFQALGYFQVSAQAREAWNACAASNENLGACLLLDFIAEAPRRLPRFPTPASVLPHTADQFTRILNEVERNPGAQRDLDGDLFLKDLALARLACFPCVAQIVDRNSGIGRRIVMQNLMREPSALLSMGLASGFRFAPTFEAHTHTPMLRGFTPAGWEQCFLLVADLLELYPHYHGMTSGSWFYDPELKHVSPTLSFLRDRPVSGGAFLLPLGQTPADIANATYNSPPRRKLYEAGEYRPTGWMLVWPRQALLTWARAQRKTCSEN